MPQIDLPYFSQLGPALRLARDRAKVTAAAVARRAGIGKSQLSKYENGRELPRMDSLAKVLDALGVDPLWLFYMMHLLSRDRAAGFTPGEQPVDALRVDLLLLRGGVASSVSQGEADGFRRVLDSLLDLHTLIVEERIRTSYLSPPSLE